MESTEFVQAEWGVVSTVGRGRDAQPMARHSKNGTERRGPCSRVGGQIGPAMPRTDRRLTAEVSPESALKRASFGSTERCTGLCHATHWAL